MFRWLGLPKTKNMLRVKTHVDALALIFYLSLLDNHYLLQDGSFLKESSMISSSNSCSKEADCEESLLTDLDDPVMESNSTNVVTSSQSVSDEFHHFDFDESYKTM